MDKDDDDRDSQFHAADEPTAMWGSDALAELGLAAPLEGKATGPATAGGAKGSESSIQVSLGSAEAPHQAVGKPGPELRGKGSVVPWLLTFVGAVLLAVGAFLLVRMFRG